MTLDKEGEPPMVTPLDDLKSLKEWSSPPNDDFQTKVVMSSNADRCFDWNGILRDIILNDRI